MKNVMFLIMVVVLATACTVNKKYVEINVKDGELTVEGNVDPRFMRENTTESQENTPTVSPTIQVKPLECRGCHAAWAGELFWGKVTTELEKEPEIKEPEVKEPVKPPAAEPDPVVMPDPPPATVTERLTIHSSRNAPYWQYYAGRPIAAYPGTITVRAGAMVWVINLTGRSRPGYVGRPGADHSPYFGQGDYIIKNSDVPGRGMTILLHERYGKHATITLSY